MAKRLYVGLLATQLQLLRRYGRCEAPPGRTGAHYWPMKDTQAAAAASVATAFPTVAPQQVALLPVSLTHVGLRDLLDMGELWVVDEHQYRLYGPLRDPGPQDAAGHSLYVLHPETYLA